MNNAAFCRQVKRAASGLFRTALIAAISLLGFGLAPKAHASECTAATLHGPYGLSETGAHTGTGTSSVPFAVAGLLVFDGAANVSANVTVNFDGTAFPASVPGTYTVNSDCTATLSFANGETFFGAIVNNGRELQFINVTSGFLGAAGVAKKVADYE
jgi:hypothetical protein